MPWISWLFILGALAVGGWMAWGVAEPYWEYWERCYDKELERLAARSLTLKEQGTDSYIVVLALHPMLLIGRKARHSLVPSETREYFGKKFTLYRIHADRMFSNDP